MRRRLGSQVFELLGRGGATQYLVAVRVAPKARYDATGGLGLRDPELVWRLEVRRCVGRFLLGVAVCSAGVSAGIDMALQLAARLTDEQTSREVQYQLGYDPEPPFGSIDYEHICGQLGVWGTGVTLAAPVIAAKPKRLTSQGR